MTDRARLVLPPVPAVAVTTGLCELIPATDEWLRETWPCAECDGNPGDLRCDRCKASASLPLGTTCADHNPRRWCSTCDGRGWLVPSDARLDIWTDDTPPEAPEGWRLVPPTSDLDRWWLLRGDDDIPADRFPVPAPNSFAGRVQVTGCPPIIDGSNFDFDTNAPVLLADKDGPTLYGPLLSNGRDVSASAAWWPEGSFPVGGWALTVQGETRA